MVLDPRARLRRLVDLLGERAEADREPATARALAEAAGISLRTVYRDLGRLRLAGVRVVGRAGVGLKLDGPARAPALAVEGEIVARVRGSKGALRSLRGFAVVEHDERGSVRVRVAREALLRAVLGAGGELVVLAPDDLRRDVRARAREMARAHKRA